MNEVWSTIAKALPSINWKVRFTDPKNIGRLFVAVIVPVLGYYGITSADITSWSVLGDTLLKAIGNPYVLMTAAVNFYVWAVDPTTAGASDSKEALGYTKPKEAK
ncbi:phage holin [Lacticaseibacillus hulanensis]|uniref:phage holin n=1 Tax=Lacticaseibacillus hulanensis TaxID=2493111 RepID=UPI000FD933EC|nr:phage holin [Lacticaseibacillus hulanensis]